MKMVEIRDFNVKLEDCFMDLDSEKVVFSGTNEEIRLREHDVQVFSFKVKKFLFLFAFLFFFVSAVWGFWSEVTGELSIVKTMTCLGVVLLTTLMIVVWAFLWRFDAVIQLKKKGDEVSRTFLLQNEEFKNLVSYLNKRKNEKEKKEEGGGSNEANEN
jgi:uncharacterized membrane protein YcjF (UPF0283 family)